MPKFEYSKLEDSDVEVSSKFQRTFIGRYYGRALVERWHTQPMLPWIIAEIQRMGSPKSDTVFLCVTECSIKATHVKFGRVVFEHKLGSITKFNQLADSPRCFAYLTKEGSDVSLCHAFQASDELAVFQIFTVLKEAIQESSIGIRAKDDSPFDIIHSKQCQQYEVLYVGKSKVSQKRGPQRFVDEVTKELISEPKSPIGDRAPILKKLESKASDQKINIQSAEVIPETIKHPLLPEIDKDPFSGGMRQRVNSENAQTLTPPSTSLITHTQSLDRTSRDDLVKDIQTLAFTSEQFTSIIEDGSLHRQTSLPPMNAKTFLECSLGFPFSQEDSSHSLSDDPQQDNRTMLFLISPTDIRLISTDKKELLFQKDFASISHCSQGEEFKEYFGIICRETTITGMDMYVGYIFQCQSAKIVNEIMKSLKQCFHCAITTSQEKRALSKIFNFCDSCPMNWFHKLCSDTEGEAAEKVKSILMMHVAALAEKEQKELMSKYQEIIVRSLAEQNIVFMTLLRSLCEQKQMKHAHSISKDHKDKRAMSPLNNLTSMAKKNFSTFKDAPLTKAYSLPVGARSDIKLSVDKKNAPRSQELSKHSAVNTGILLNIEDAEEPQVALPESSKKQISMPAKDGAQMMERLRKESRTGTERSLSDTAAVLWDLHEGDQQKGRNMTTSDVRINELPRSSLKASPLRNIFLRVGSKKGTPPLKGIKEQQGSKGSWRKMLFNRVQKPCTKDIIFGEIVEEKQIEPPKHSSSQLKALWKKAIMEQIILIRLEREQKKLKMKQDRILEKHVRLDYEVICPCPDDAVQKWQKIITSNADYESIESAVAYGLPLQKRGEIWNFLANKYRNSRKCVSIDNTPYLELLRKLTPYQHAILVDIGRTYPCHPYFKPVLGSGQLSLFSLLKAYSVVDEEVGYCQGLSFLGGILLLHMDEEKGFNLMKHIMFTLELRNQYKADMAALQVQMYQLARLVQNTVPEVHDLLDRLEISPMLYAAPWFLTLFASHFSIGFVARLIDLFLLQGISVLFKVSTLLLKVYQTQILKCNSFESVVSFLKTTLPSTGHVGMEKVLEQVLSMDVDQQLQTYQIEYMVLKEEMSEHGADIESTSSVHKEVENENKEIQKQNMELSEQLQVALNTVGRLEASVTTYQSTIRKLESHVRTLQDERDALHHSVNILRKRLDTLESEMPTASAMSQLDSDIASMMKK